MQPSSSTRATSVIAENQNDVTIVKAIFFFFHFYIVSESNNAGGPRTQSWNESVKSRCIQGWLCGLYEWYKMKTFCCAFFAAAMMTMVPAATMVRFPPLCCVLQACPIMVVWSIQNLVIVMYFTRQQWHCQADVYHVGYLAANYADKEDRFAAVPMALAQYLLDHANDTVLSSAKHTFKWA